MHISLLFSLWVTYYFTITGPFDNSKKTSFINFYVLRSVLKIIKNPNYTPLQTTEVLIENWQVPESNHSSYTHDRCQKMEHSVVQCNVMQFYSTIHTPLQFACCLYNMHCIFAQYSLYFTLQLLSNFVVNTFTVLYCYLFMC